MEDDNDIYNAARDGDLRSLKNLLDVQQETDVQALLSSSTFGSPPLVIAAQTGHLDVVRYLIKKGADIEQTGNVVFDDETIVGAPALWCAAASGHFEIVKLLVERGANVNHPTAMNSTPLKAACFCPEGHLEIVKFLLEHEGDIELANRHGMMNEDSMVHVINVFIEILNSLSSADSRDEDAELRTDRIYSNLRTLANDQSVDRTVIVRTIMKRLMSILSMRSAESLTNVPAKIVYAKDSAVAFIGNLLADIPDVVAPLIYILLQNLCTNCVDKAAFRGKCATTIVDLAATLPDDYFHKFATWLFKFSRNTKVSYRVFAIDLTMSILKKIAERRSSPVLEALQAELVQTVINRCSDKAANVRMRALGGVFSLLSDEKNSYRPVISTICASGNVTSTPFKAVNVRHHFKDIATPIVWNKDSTHGSSLRRIEMRQSGEVSITETSSFVPLILQRCADEKTLVRKIAVQTLEAVVLTFPETLDDQTLNAFKEACMDPSLSVRKQGAESITKILLRFNDNETLDEKWLSSILPLVIDRETTVLEKASDLIVSTIFDNLITKNCGDASLTRMVWRLLMKIEREREYTRYLLRLIQKLVKSNSFHVRIVNAVEERSKEPETSQAAWMVLAELSRFLKMSPTLAKNVWLNGEDINSAIVSYVANVLANNVEKLSDVETNTLLADMAAKVNAFQVAPEHLAAVLHAVSSFHRRIFGEDRTQFKKWCMELEEACEHYLSCVVYSPTSPVIDTGALIRRLMTLGEIVQLSTNGMSEKVFVILQALVVCDERTKTDQDGDLVLSQNLQQQLSGRRSSIFDEKIRAFAIVALGKLCLHDEELAKRCVPSLARKLETSSSKLIRNNVMVVLADLCIRYTSLIDRHMASISKCLRDKSSLVRSQTLTLLTLLLKEDYLKWRGALFHRFVVSLLDRDDEIRAFTEFCLVNVLLNRHPMMFFNHFVECVFVFNGARCPGVGGGSICDLDEEANSPDDDFKLDGVGNQASRMEVYKFMLLRFNDQQRFQTSSRLCQDVLGAIVDEALALTSTNEQILYDALTILGCKEMKLCSLRRPAVMAEEDEVDGDDEPAAAGQEMADMARRALIQAVKRSTIENIVPTVVSLKHMLERKRNPMLRDVMLYLRELMKDYKNEIHEMLAVDEQLGLEIAYDLKRLEAKENSSGK